MSQLVNASERGVCTVTLTVLNAAPFPGEGGVSTVQVGAVPGRVVAPPTDKSRESAAVALHAVPTVPVWPACLPSAPASARLSAVRCIWRLRAAHWTVSVARPAEP